MRRRVRSLKLKRINRVIQLKDCGLPDSSKDQNTVNRAESKACRLIVKAKALTDDCRSRACPKSQNGWFGRHGGRATVRRPIAEKLLQLISPNSSPVIGIRTT
jgi:hypothetical protein